MADYARPIHIPRIVLAIYFFMFLGLLFAAWTVDTERDNYIHLRDLERHATLHARIQ